MNGEPFDEDDFDDFDEYDEYESAEQDEWGDESEPVVPCPVCGFEIHEDAIRCPHCETYVTHSSHIWAGRSWWWIAIGLLGIAAVVLTLIVGF